MRASAAHPRRCQRTKRGCIENANPYESPAHARRGSGLVAQLVGKSGYTSRVTHDRVTEMALAAARSPGAAFMLLDPRGDGPRVAVLATGARPLVCVAHDRPDGALDAFGDALDALRNTTSGDPVLPVAFGCVSYDAAWHAASPRPVRDARPSGDRCPAAWLARYDDVTAVALPEGFSPAVEAPSLGPFESATGRDAHMRHVEAVREAIRDGDVYLVNLARMLHAKAPGDPGDLALRALASGARYAAVMRAGDALVAGMSMELALTWDRATGLARSRPIKGTRPRGRDPEGDRREAEALARDPKERAENAMAVDVHRNDLGRVAVTGSVRVPRLFEAEAHRFVHHLVSTVEATVPGDTPARDVLRAMLPVGSVTGAPKLAAMEHIARFERERRGLYTGVYGAVYGDGSVQLAVAIRTLVADAAGLHYGVGGGVVWDSDPAREWQELAWKQRAAGGGGVTIEKP